MNVSSTGHPSAPSVIIIPVPWTLTSFFLGPSDIRGKLKDLPHICIQAVLVWQPSQVWKSHLPIPQEAWFSGKILAQHRLGRLQRPMANWRNMAGKALVCFNIRGLAFVLVLLQTLHHVSFPVYHWGGSGQVSKAGPAAETMEDCCLLACSLHGLLL